MVLLLFRPDYVYLCVYVCTPVRRNSSGKRDNAMLYWTLFKENTFYRERVL